jgi:hypothetical protein
VHVFPCRRPAAGQFMVLLDRGDYWQCGYVIRKGEFEQNRQRGLEELRADVSRCAPFLHDRVAELKDWNAVDCSSSK